MLGIITVIIVIWLMAIFADKEIKKDESERFRLILEYTDRLADCMIIYDYKLEQAVENLIDYSQLIDFTLQRDYAKVLIMHAISKEERAYEQKTN